MITYCSIKNIRYITASSNPGVNVRILLCTMQFGPGYNQGTEKYVRNLARDLSEQGCEVVVAGGDPEDILTDSAMTNEGNIQYLTLPTFGWSTIGGDSIGNYVKLLSELKPDVVHMANPAHIGVNILNASRELGIPYFVSVTDFWWLCPKHTLTLKSRDFCKGFSNHQSCMRCITETHPNRLIRTAAQFSPVRNGIAEVLHRKNVPAAIAEDRRDRKQILTAILSNAKQVICISKTGQKLLSEYFALGNSHYIPAGLADTWFETDEASRNKRDRFVVGFLGAVAPHKGLHTLSRALQELNDQDIELRVAGKLVNRRYARQSLGQYPCTRYFGELNEQESRDFLDDLDILAIPSNSPENQPQVLLEAGARQKPTVASNTPGCAELLPESALFPVADFKQLKNLLERAKQNISSIGRPQQGLSARAVSVQILTEYQKVL